MKGAVAIAAGLVAGALPVGADDGGVEFFEKRIRPVLSNHCYECHSEDAGKRKGGLWLDRRAGWQVGGDSGPVIVPGEPEESLLLTAMKHADPKLEMPPAKKLPSSVIEDFARWIAMGAPDPRDSGLVVKAGDVDWDAARSWWSFQPRAEDYGERTRIDDFIAQRLAENDLEWAPPARPEDRLRRLRFDLTGLPPTVAEQQEWIASPTRAKWEELVDRWIASEAFGERWGRYWLDTVRYADTSGGGRALTFSEAWRYRDYVIEAFREDRPLDRVMIEHIAGDLLPYGDQEERNRNMVATGFLLLGPHNYENQNKDELDLEIVDEQLDTIGKAFMGLTLGCARCHDHKFDPVSIEDYYAMAGIFMSTEVVAHANVSRWNTEPLPPDAESARRMSGWHAEREQLEVKLAALQEEKAELGVKSPGKGGSAAEDLPGIVIDDRDAHRVGDWQESTHSGRWVGGGYIHDQNDRSRTMRLVYTGVVPEAGSWEVRISYAAGPNRNRAVPVTVEAGGEVLTVHVDQQLPPSHDGLFETVATLELAARTEVRVTISNDGPQGGHTIADAMQLIPASQSEKAGDDAKLKEAKERLLRRFAETEEAKKAIDAKLGAIPSAMAVVDRSPEEIGGTELRIRGVEGNKGAVISRGFLEVATWEEPQIPDDASGRLEMAQWMTDPRHPLTARVLANRMWLKLMGEGIVSSVDNFGPSGVEPTHPALLDYLANRLIDSGWSARSLIREIVLSDVYSLSSDPPNTSAAREIDPGNRLYWRANRRSLDAEALRDSILQVAGVLERNGGGPSLPKGFKSEFGHEFTTRRRSVYVPVFRNAGHELFATFDFANPNFTSGKRHTSTIPTQALFLTNSGFVHEQSHHAARHLLDEKVEGGDEARIDLAFRTAVGRMPSSEERRLALEFLRDSGDPAGGDDPDAWAALQRSLFACLDFRFLK